MRRERGRYGPSCGCRRWRRRIDDNRIGAGSGERTGSANGVKGLLASQRVRMPVGKDFATRLERVRLRDGSSLPARFAGAA